MADEAHERTDKILEKTQEKIARIYAQASAEVSQKLEDYYARLKVKNEKKKELLADGKITPAEYTQWLYGQMCIGERWQEMRDTLAQDLVNANSIARSVIMDSVPEVYALNHNYATFQVERDSLVDTSYTLYNRHTVEYLMRDDQILLPFPTTGSPRDKELRERADLIWNRQHLSNAITQGVLQGESIPQISKRLERVVGMDKVAATRNARTMMTGAQNKGRQDAYDDLKSKGIELAEKWLATLDNVTRHSHRDLHGEYKDPKTGTFSNGLEYPGDPFGAPEEVYNCRCTMIAEVEGFSIETPKTSPKLGDMSFDEWLGEHRTRETETAEPEYHYYKEMSAVGFDKETTQVLENRFKELDAKYGAEVSGIMNMLELDQRDYDLEFEAYVKYLQEQNPRMRESTARKKTLALLGERPTGQTVEFVCTGGYFNLNTREMALNPEYGANGITLADDLERLRRFTERNQRWIEKGRTPRTLGNVAGSFESVFIHEYGHAIDRHYKIGSNQKFLDEFRDVLNDKEYIEKDVSSYATENRDEFIAEMFAQSFMGEYQGELSKRFMRVLEEIVNDSRK